ncbi:hypothetical protein ACQCN2_05135 [Brevibacillus ginsengisoli]
MDFVWDEIKSLATGKRFNMNSIEHANSERLSLFGLFSSGCLIVT